MILSVRRKLAKFSYAAILSVALILVTAPVADALNAGSGITLGNGNVSLNEILVADCAPSDGNAMKWTNSTGQISCESVVVTSTVTTVYAFSSETPIDLAAAGTIYVGVGGGVSTSFVNVGVPVTGGTFGNLRCAASADPQGTALKVNFVTDACSEAAPTAQANLEIADLSTSGVADTDGTVTVADNNCVGILLTDSGNTDSVNVKCSFERIS